MNPEYYTYTVRTRHSSNAPGGGTGNKFIVPVEITALSHEEAVRERFETLSSREQENCVALLVNTKHGSPQLFTVEKNPNPQYQIKAA